MDFKIYILIDPITNQIRYVGQTRVSLPKRLTAHINEKGFAKKHQWIKSLKNKSSRPIIECIDKFNCIIECNIAEVFYIQYFKFIGAKLTNVTEGGRGSVGVKQSQETIAKRVKKLKGQKRSDETRKRMSEIQKSRDPKTWERLGVLAKERGMPRSVIEASIASRKNRTPEQKAFYGDIIRKSNKTRIISEETRIKLKNRKRPPLSKESRDKIRKKLTGVKHTKERSINIAIGRQKAKEAKRLHVLKNTIQLKLFNE